MKKSRKRNIKIEFYVYPEEKTLIDEKVKISGKRSMSDYLRQAACYNKIAVYDFSVIKEMNKQINAIGVNVNQLVARVNSYEYVISTHVDKEHIHNHIIINSVNFETGKAFSTEHDTFRNPAWKKIRSISDELCREYGLSVISNPERGKGKSHYEWEQTKSGNSWKNKLKISIDECIKTAASFDDFLEKMKELDYEIKRGKHIAFRAKGQERFTRAKTIGYYYTEEQIKYRISRRIM